MASIRIVALSLLCAGCAQALDAEVRSVHQLKVKDAVTAYEQARTGAALDRCVKAKLVALAYEDAKDPTSASTWHAREKEDCQAALAAAGVEVPAQPSE